ncbi:MAG TPA: hypothetical protein VKU80_10770 [Planctomycetota bacterium]|nr:hypothetical protein [Planctomycetota bacterium]
MKILIGLAFLLGSAGGCIIEDDHPRHGGPAVENPEHHHGKGCGHVNCGGVWYDER